MYIYTWHFKLYKISETALKISQLLLLQFDQPLRPREGDRTGVSEEEKEASSKPRRSRTEEKVQRWGAAILGHNFLPTWSWNLSLRLEAQAVGWGGNWRCACVGARFAWFPIFSWGRGPTGSGHPTVDSMQWPSGRAAEPTFSFLKLLPAALMCCRGYAKGFLCTVEGRQALTGSFWAAGLRRETEGRAEEGEEAQGWEKSQHSL